MGFRVINCISRTVCVLRKTRINTFKNELNLLDSEEVTNWFKLNKPTVVIMAAAKVGGILANSNYPYDFLLENLKVIGEELLHHLG